MYPTPMQEVVAVHDTPPHRRSTDWSGVPWVTQVLPFQDCTRVCSLSAKLVTPMAVQAVLDVQETALSCSTCAPLTAGVRVAVQVEPSQVSTSAPGVPP